MCLEESAHACDSQIGPTKPQIVFAVNGRVCQHELASTGIVDALTVHHHELTPSDMVSPVGECLNDVEQYQLRSELTDTDVWRV